MKTYFSNIKFTKNQRIGIIILLIIIFVLQIVIYKINNRTNIKQTYIMPTELQKQYDSLKVLALEKKKQKIYPFNPNYLSDEKAYFLGIGLDELKKIKTYRKQGNFFQTKEDFKKISGISDSLYNKLEPYIRFPKFANYSSNKPRIKLTTKDINQATATDLQTINGIGNVLSKRIVKYRNSIGGFENKNQLNEVYGLEKEVINKIWKVFYIGKTPKTKTILIKKGINSADIEELKEVPGIGEKLSKRIVNYRNKLGGFSIVEQLNEIYGLKPETIQMLWKYFEIKNPKKITNKIDLNDANIKELAQNPYIDYSLAKKIVSYRTLHGAFSSINELMQIESFPKNKLKVIGLYLKIDKIY